MQTRTGPIGALFLSALLGFTPAVAAQETARQLLLTDPLPESPARVVDTASVSSVTPIAEIDPHTTWPSADDGYLAAAGRQVRWNRVDAGRPGQPAPADGTVQQWAACYATVDRFGPVELGVEGAGALRLYVDGEEADSGGEPTQTATRLDKKVSWHRGTHRILLRVARGTALEKLVVTVECTAGQRVLLSLEPRHAVADYDELKEAVSLSGLSLSPDGNLLALRQSERSRDGSAGWNRLDVIGVRSGATVAPFLGGSGARAVAWRHDGEQLLFRQKDDLFTWNRADGEVRRILSGEPGLGGVSWSRDGRLLVFSSTNGARDAATGNLRRVELREKLSDWPTRPHLHLLMVESGVRHRLTTPGDWLQDAFELLPDGRRLLYLVNRPMAERPWFRTEFRILDLASSGGDGDRLVGSVVMGFENRPGMSGLAISPDGQSVAFIGPPSELGERASVEPSAFDPNLFVMKLSDGSFTRVTRGFHGSVDGHLTWAADSKSIHFAASIGSRSRLVRLDLASNDGRPRLEISSAGGEVIQDVSMSVPSAGAARQFAAVVSSEDRLPALYVSGRAADDEPRLLRQPNRELASRWHLSASKEVRFAGPDGTQIEGWLFRPDGPNRLEPASGSRLPLIVYYYGGATPSKRGFNELHQFLVANGYALFVLNPRGAAGYGQEFSDQHVAEWGERAGADILEGVRHVLAANADLDPDRVGCYGGSYGGFMTMWLICHSDRFAAAVSLYGISNIASYFGEGMWGYTYGDQAINRYPWRDPDWFISHSPLFHADQVNTPLLLLHGDQDGNVPSGESEQMFTALRLLGKPAELVTFPGEDHGLRGSWSNRVAHRTMLLEWFDRYLKDQPEAWQARWD